MNRCAVHPRFTGRGLPTSGSCDGCWAVYGRTAATREVRSVGHARGGGRSSKAKGRAACLIVAAMIREALGLDEADVFVKATSQVGVDLHLSPRALAVFPYGIEVKGAESLNVWKALAQAGANADGRSPILFFKRARTEMFVALRAADFLQVLRDVCARRNQIDPQNDARRGDEV